MERKIKLNTFWNKLNNSIPSDGSEQEKILKIKSREIRHGAERNLTLSYKKLSCEKM